MNLGLQTLPLRYFSILVVTLLFQPYFLVRFLVLHNAFFTEIDLALSLPTGLALGAADRKIRDLHVRGFYHSSEYISYGTESKEKSDNGI